MNSHQEQLLKSVEILVREIIKTLPYNYTIEGKVIGNIDANKYKVSYNGEECIAKAVNGQTYQINDIVEILVVNNNFSDKKILWKTT